jgi:hypothetical protein
MLQICILPGPNTAKKDGFWSFLAPLIDEIKVLASRGMDVRCDDGVTRHSKVRLMVVTGDVVGVSTLACHAGHTSKSGCRICLVKGVTGESKRGMYFKPIDPNLSIPWRSHESFVTGDTQVKKKRREEEKQ